MVLLMEGDQLVEDVGSRLEAAMAHELPAGHDEEGQTAEARGDLDMVVPRVFALGLPAIGQSPEVVIAFEQVIGDPQKRCPQAAVGAADQRTVGEVDLVALIARGEQAGAAGDGAGMGIVGDGAHLAGELAAGGHVDAGDGQQEHIGRLDQQCRDFFFDSLDFPRFLDSIVVQRRGEALVEDGLWVPGRCGPRPREDPLQGTHLDGSTRVAEGLLKARQPGLLDRLRRDKPAGDDRPRRRVPEVGEQGGESGQGGFPMLAELAADGRTLFDQIAAMTLSQPQSLDERFQRLFQEAGDAKGDAKGDILLCL